MRTLAGTPASRSAAAALTPLRLAHDAATCTMGLLELRGSRGRLVDPGELSVDIETAAASSTSRIGEDSSSSNPQHDQRTRPSRLAMATAAEGSVTPSFR